MKTFHRTGHRTRSRAIAIAARKTPAREAVLALLAGFAFLAAAIAAAPRAEGQVFSSQPYVAAPDPAVEQLRTRLETLEAEVKRATDRAERLAFELAQIRKTADEANAGRKQAEQNLASMQQRLRALEMLAGTATQDDAAATPSANVQSADAGPTINLLPAGVSTNAEGLSSQGASASLPDDEEGLLRESKNLLLGGNYAGAQKGYAAFLAKYGKSPNAHEAQYNLGESLLYQESYQEAANAYGKLLSAYPKSPNGPSALVKLARSMRLLNKPAEACKTLALMTKQFPKASASAKQLAEAERQKANCK
jgi:tol-pal system protein YbgF